MPHAIHTAAPAALDTPRLQVRLAQDAADLEAAQRLRYRIFSEEFDARFSGPAPGLDGDRFDAHCTHLLVHCRDSGRLVATTRLLDAEGAAACGGFYSSSEFSLHGLTQLPGRVLEIGRTCVDSAYRHGGTIAVLWQGLAGLLLRRRIRFLFGCASISMSDGGIQTEAIMQQLRRQYLDTQWLHAIPRVPVPLAPVPDNLITRMPPLLKSYLRLGARVCGEPSWVTEFATADVLILLDRKALAPRYARHFLQRQS